MASLALLLLLSLGLLLLAAHPPLCCQAVRHGSSSPRGAAPTRTTAALAAPKLRLRDDDDALFPNGTGVTRGDFPDGFLFGAITSSMKEVSQKLASRASAPEASDTWLSVVGGSNASSVEALDVVDLRNVGSCPEVLAVNILGYAFAGVDSLPGDCGNNYDLYKLDHSLIANLGMNSYRLSIAWSRVYPNGNGEVNEVAITHYNEVINDILKHGLIPMVTLWTQDHPQALEDQYGGALDPQYVTDFVNYADTCFKAFGDRVKFWITFDEANDWSGLGYTSTLNPPGRCTSGLVGLASMYYGNCSAGDSATEPYIVAHNLLLAHAEAVDLYRTKYQPTQNGSVGLALWFRWAEPLTDTAEDIAAAQRGTDFLVGWFLDPIFFGDYPESMREIVGSRLPNFTAEEMGKIQGSLDFIGLNIQTAIYFYNTDWYTNTTTEKCYYLDWHANITGEKDGVSIGVGTNDYAVPWSIRKAVEYTSERYSNFPMYITQTGWGIRFDDGEDTLDDDQRVEFFMTYYDELRQAITNGANVKGVYAWSLIDGFEFDLGLATRVAIHYVDDDYNRYPRKSAMWFKEMLSQNSSMSARTR